MPKKQKALLLILLLQGFCLSCAFSPALVKIGKVLYNVLEFSLKIWEIFDAFDEGQSDSADFNQLRHEIETMIQSAEKKIIQTISIENKMSKVVDAANNIKSSLNDLNIVALANDSVTRQEYLDLFCNNFDKEGVSKDVGLLPDHLTDTWGGTSPPLVDLIVDQHRCNMTALYEFMTYYCNLESSGIALEKLYLKYKLPSLLNIKETERYENIKSINTTFEKREAVCKERFLKLAQEDMAASTYAIKLLENNNQRYPWVTSDVFFLHPYRTHQFLYMKYLDGSLIWERSESNKIVAFSVRDDVQYKNVSFSMQGAKDILKKFIEGKDDTSAAKNVGDAVERLLDTQGFCAVTLLVFFDGGDYASRATELDNDSPVIFTALEGVELRYCSKSEELCKTDPEKILHYGTVWGQMKIAAYVKEKALCAEITQEYKIAGTSNLHASFYTYITMYVLLACCYVVTL